eukprot:s934_g26.t1
MPTPDGQEVLALQAAKEHILKRSAPWDHTEVKGASGAGYDARVKDTSPGRSMPAWAKTHQQRLEQELEQLRKWKFEAAGAVQRMALGLRSLRDQYDHEMRKSFDLQETWQRLGHRAENAGLATSFPSVKEADDLLQSEGGKTWAFADPPGGPQGGLEHRPSSRAARRSPKAKEASPTAANLSAGWWNGHAGEGNFHGVMGSSSSAEEGRNAVSESYSYSNVETGEEGRLSPYSPKGALKSRDATPMSIRAEATGSTAQEERVGDPALVFAAPAAFTKVKLWQLVLFSTLLFLMFVCTIMVLISYCGGYLGYAPLTARSPKIQRPKVVEHPWKMENVALDCSTERWRDTEEWSDIKLDYCCENTGVGCERVPGYSCDTMNEAAIFVAKRWCCTQESILCEKLDHDLQVVSKQGLPECSKPGVPGSCREFDCNKGHEHWWLDTCQGGAVMKLSSVRELEFPCFPRAQQTEALYLTRHSLPSLAGAQVHVRCPACSQCSSASACSAAASCLRAERS